MAPRWQRKGRGLGALREKWRDQTQQIQVEPDGDVFLSSEIKPVYLIALAVTAQAICPPLTAQGKCPPL